MKFYIKKIIKDIEIFFINKIKKNKKKIYLKKKKLLLFSSIALAFSGGIDSSVLLYISKLFSKKYNIKVFVFHINHKLNIYSYLWKNFCKIKCFELNLKFNSKHFILKKNTESFLRLKRYLYLGKFCNKNNIKLIIIAHHQDDQIETILFKLFRGTGINGIIGMNNYKVYKFFKKKKIILFRPFLSQKKKNIIRYAYNKNISFINDNSNKLEFYKRNILRNKIIPIISKFFPIFKKCLIRSSLNFKSYKYLLNTLIYKDFKKCYKNNYICINKIKRIKNYNRIINLLYYWIKLKNKNLISKKLLKELYKKIINYNIKKKILIKFFNKYYLINIKNKIFFIYFNNFNNFLKINNFFFLKGEKKIDFPNLLGYFIFKIDNKFLKFIKNEKILINKNKNNLTKIKNFCIKIKNKKIFKIFKILNKKKFPMFLTKKYNFYNKYINIKFKFYNIKKFLKII